MALTVELEQIDLELHLKISKNIHQNKFHQKTQIISAKMMKKGHEPMKQNNPFQQNLCERDACLPAKLAGICMVLFVPGIVITVFCCWLVFWLC